MPNPKFPWYFYSPESREYRAGRRRWERQKPKDDSLGRFAWLFWTAVVIEAAIFLWVSGALRIF